MVLTDLPFERGALLHSRYNTIRRPESAPVPVDEDNKRKESKEYASFLRDQDRKVGPDGFLDSNRYSHTFQVKKDKDRQRAVSDLGRPSVVKLTAKIGQDQKDYDRRIRVIEDHMWQHKQEERELKRTEGDIIKNQRSVRHSLRDFENAINKKRMSEERKLNTGLEKYTVLKRDHVHQKHDSTKNRIRQRQNVDQSFKDKDRKTQLKQSDLSRKYKSKMSEIELKRIEVMRMSQDFESKMRQKEEEQYKLKQELADLAIALNMEAQKGRQQVFDSERERKKETANRITEDLNAKQTLDNKIARSDGDTKGAEMSKRKLSADLVLTKAHIAIKQRDEQRHLTDTQMKLDDNSNVQKQLNEAAFHAEMDLKTKQMQQNIEAHNARRKNQLATTMRERKQKQEVQQAVLEERFKKRQNEHQRREHEDSLKFFQKVVQKGGDLEQQLYNKVRTAEYQRQKQEQAVRRLQQQLMETKRNNATRIKQELAERYRAEQDMEQKYLREKAELDKVHSQREESYVRLQKHRQLLKEDKHNLEEHEREHQRLVRIGSKTESMDLY